MKKLNYVHMLVCPIIVGFVFYHMTFHDYDDSVMGIFSTSCFGLTTLLYVLVMFSEVWLLSALTFAPLISYYMYKTSQTLKDIEVIWIFVFSLFQIFIFISVSYKIERITKECFLYKENLDRSFHRWFKIFESFPEGIAMIKEDGQIQYSNPALMQLLDLDQGLDEKSEINMMSSFSRRGSASDSLSLRSKLEMTKITKWTPPDLGVPAKS